LFFKTALQLTEVRDEGCLDTDSALRAGAVKKDVRRQEEDQSAGTGVRERRQAGEGTFAREKPCKSYGAR
jgi:hypothetical protein